MFQQYQTPDYATFWHRLAAYLIGWVLAMAVFCPVGVAMGALGAVGGREAEAVGLALNVIANLVSLVVTWLYYALMESSSWQGTLGKRLLGIKVTDLNGDRISFARATGRHFAKIISSLICLVGFIMVAFTERKQGLHDMMAGTLVLQGAGTGTGGVTINDAPPQPPSDFGQGGGYGGGYGGTGGGSYGGEGGGASGSGGGSYGGGYNG
jgi:uncharacterized RDD family membrane protein YckC